MSGKMFSHATPPTQATPTFFAEMFGLCDVDKETRIVLTCEVVTLKQVDLDLNLVTVQTHQGHTLEVTPTLLRPPPLNTRRLQWTIYTNKLMEVWFSKEKRYRTAKTVAESLGKRDYHDEPLMMEFLAGDGDRRIRVHRSEARHYNFNWPFLSAIDVAQMYPDLPTKTKEVNNNEEEKEKILLEEKEKKLIEEKEKKLIEEKEKKVIEEKERKLHEEKEKKSREETISVFLAKTAEIQRQLDLVRNSWSKSSSRLREYQTMVHTLTEWSNKFHAQALALEMALYQFDRAHEKQIKMWRKGGPLQEKCVQCKGKVDFNQDEVFACARGHALCQICLSMVRECAECQVPVWMYRPLYLSSKEPPVIPFPPPNHVDTPTDNA